jgi:hypothetical protein
MVHGNKGKKKKVVSSTTLDVFFKPQKAAQAAQKAAQAAEAAAHAAHESAPTKRPRGRPPLAGSSGSKTKTAAKPLKRPHAHAPSLSEMLANPAHNGYAEAQAQAQKQAPARMAQAKGQAQVQAQKQMQVHVAAQEQSQSESKSAPKKKKSTSASKEYVPVDPWEVRHTRHLIHRSHVSY